MDIVDVVILARKSNIRSPDGYKLTVSHMSIEDLQRFAKLVAAAEREDCAKVCEGINGSALWFAKQIRARSNHD